MSELEKTDLPKDPRRLAGTSDPSLTDRSAQPVPESDSHTKWENLSATAQNFVSLRDLYNDFGGIPRAVLQHFHGPRKHLHELFTLTDRVMDALTAVNSEDANHNRVSCTILHMVPDATLRFFIFTWASTAMMETAFGLMFRLTKTKVETFLHGAMGLHLGTFYGLLFEPVFHERYLTRQWDAKMRPLGKAETKFVQKVVRRQQAGKEKLTFIPKRKKIFLTHREIDAERYKPDFCVVMTLAPGIEMFLEGSEGLNLDGVIVRRRDLEHESTSWI